MPRFDLLLFDLDGTLLGPDHARISERNIRALETTRRKGVALAFATGRCLRLISREAMDLKPDYVITSNGAAVRDLRSGRTVYRHPFPPDLARIACRAVSDHTDFFELFASDVILIPKKAEILLKALPLPPWHRHYFERSPLPLSDIDVFFDSGAPGLEKINLVACDPEAVARIKMELETPDLFELTCSIGRGSMEIVPKGCTKGEPIRQLCAAEGIDIARTAAFGDGGNDGEMLRAAGCGIAMGNASESLKAAADAVTGPFDRDGVAQYIEEFI